MTIEVKTQTLPGPLAAPRTLRYAIKSIMIGDQRGSRCTTKTLRDYIIHVNGQAIPISEGRFKKMKKQHEARNRYASGDRMKVYIRHGFTRLFL